MLTSAKSKEEKYFLVHLHKLFIDGKFVQSFSFMRLVDEKLTLGVVPLIT